MFGLSALGLLGVVALERRALRNNPMRVSVIRPARETAWHVPLDELMAAARTTGLAPRRRSDGFGLHCHGLGRALLVERANPDELGWVIWSNDSRTTAALLRAFIAQFGPLAISIPLEHGLVTAGVYTLDHERMTIFVDRRLATDTLARKLDDAHDELVAEIYKCLQLRIKIIDKMLQGPPGPMT